ncbi:MAG: site-specific DNA-methyltransferase [Acidimicrobiales bacterium]|nr:site-specific DNA-methyltransferase [Acidimicrobiales bacterium]MYG88003.1 site-specific DNA-methyltransferase [Acidimicrobiales bacterium]MYI28376.1 site-specific DNA-methyltransferase [Acidimicrobiales bacterium]
MAEPNWANKTVFTGDNLYIMRRMNSGTVDLIYLDPPFNSKRDYAAPIGSQAAGAEFSDTWTLRDVDAEWINLIEDKHPALHRILLAATTDSDKSYLAYMAVRLLELHRLLAATGSLYLHCDPTMSHYLKLLLDAIFGRSQFQNEFVWYYSGGGASKKRWARKHDVILFYARSARWTFNADEVRVPHKWTKGQRRADGSERDPRGKLADDVWQGHSVMPWSKERTGYPTQKPLTLLQRIVKASSNMGDIVLDPFCGCATTMVAADDLQRQWVGIDISPKAAHLVMERIEQRQGMFPDIIHRTDLPQRTDLGKLPPYNCRENRETLYGQQGGDCAGCRDHFQPRHLEVDHIIADKKGGTDHIDNLQLLCGHCNRVKGDRGMEYLRTKLQLGT